MTFSQNESNGLWRGLDFVLHQPGEKRWLKANGQDMHLPLMDTVDQEIPLQADEHKRLAEKIVGAEIGKNSWTLMHRFNLCHDLLQDRDQDAEALALIYTWLRYSAIRQLDWQRRYNTKPRELAHAQNRLTYRLAEIYRTYPQSRQWARFMLITLGRGGSRGQQVRDDILNIMHRHKVKKVGERFMEEWHQKLHNNTTPDDIVICEAYIAFLESDGDLEQFYSVLAAGGVTRERLNSFDRPIKTDPLFFPDKKDGLIQDFRKYMRVLKSVHSSTDLETAVTAVRGLLNEALNQKLDALFVEPPHELPEWIRPKDRCKKPKATQQPKDERAAKSRTTQFATSLVKRAQTIVDIRAGLEEQFSHQSDSAFVREMLYLDLALEEELRVLIEGQKLGELSDQTLFSLTLIALDSFCQSVTSEELKLCKTHLAALAEMPESETDWTLKLKAGVDRTLRVLADWTEAIYAQLQPKAEFLGNSFGVDDWTIPLFTEEVIRGGPAFVLSLLLRRADRVLRTSAGIGGWQVISPMHAAGKIKTVENLLSVQDESFREATVLVADRVTGEEEIPEGVTAIITTDTPDVVSHVAVRARNAHVLFATCFEDQIFADLRSRQGQNLALRVTTGGDVEYEEDVNVDQSVAQIETASSEQNVPHIRPRDFSHWAVSSQAFDNEIVGGKSMHLNALHDKLPNWIQFPVSMALPFGVFEATLEIAQNRSVQEKLQDLLAAVPDDPAKRLADVRQTIAELRPPEPLQAAVQKTWEQVGLPPVAWDIIWKTVTRVWASKWNERAYYSRASRHILEDNLMMAVLIQQVIKADYAFVIHTVNPINGNRDELYAEIVLGLGETLVGNYPGRALSLICPKANPVCSVLSYPSKSIGLYGSGVIFRSDSNGEDLEDYAGAGLYDSFLDVPPTQCLLDYSQDPLYNDRQFLKQVCSKIAQTGIEIEQTLGSPQDIEGAVQKGEFYVVQTRPQVGL